jgi:hypothetical protein
MEYSWNFICYLILLNLKSCITASIPVTTFIYFIEVTIITTNRTMAIVKIIVRHIIAIKSFNKSIIMLPATELHSFIVNVIN